MKLFSRNLSPLEREMRSKSTEELLQIVANGKKETAAAFVRNLRGCLEFERRIQHGEGDTDTEEYAERAWQALEKLIEEQVLLNT